MTGRRKIAATSRHEQLKQSSLLWWTYACGMNAYNGSAVVIADNGADVSVAANLTSYRDGLRVSWGHSRLRGRSSSGY